MNMEKLKKIIENKGFEISDTDFGIEKEPGWELQQYTPLGEDWYVSFQHSNNIDTFINSLKSYTYNFDIDEEVELYVEMRGKHGIPSSISALLEDAKWKKETLEDLLAEILTAVANDEYVEYKEVE